MSYKVVKSTTKYKIFKKLLANREVTQTRVNNIIDSIQRVGYVTSPIIVNEKMEIIDGQGRLEALQELNLPVEIHYTRRSDDRALPCHEHPAVQLDDQGVYPVIR